MNRLAINAIERPRAGAEPGLIGLAERGLIPDTLLRLGMRRLCMQRLKDERIGGPSSQAARYAERVEGLRHSPVALATEAANAQHYELPPAFFRHCLGPRFKYSCCWFPHGNETLAAAEDAMLALYDERAGLADGQHILELGCGWGSLTLWMAARYPTAQITAVSNSAHQREFIEAECRSQGLGNVQVITCDVNVLTLPERTFDRCVSVEMFEHIRNYPVLMHRIANWLTPDGKFFVHHFAHRTLLYPFETEGEDNWMGRYFFTGGLMPAADTLLHFQHDLHLEKRWLIDGTHYEKTANAWLRQQDLHSTETMEVLATAYGPCAALWFQRWRMFWMACAELFGYAGGREWMVVHQLFNKP
ncbi:MAG: class I SAM-dependent methyltransferase [Nevskiaceae bacterium]|nr:MAG: class I SAM-dependent methyltransferase [Nevskiaceae bacterium]TBR71664.1 MAG: class I SAM-dependent methyltransferase [Nevskiaceae bacterium]